MALLSRSEIADLCLELGLEDFRDGLLDALRPAFRIEQTEDGAHRVGGEPDLLRGEAWPVNEHDAALTFVAQFDASRLPAHPGGGDGIEVFRARREFVRLFFDGYHRPFERTTMVVLTGDPTAPRTRAAVPVRPALPTADDEEYAISAFADTPFDVELSWTLEPTHPAVVEAGTIETSDWETHPLRYLKSCIGHGSTDPDDLDGEFIAGQLFGAPEPVQEDPRYYGTSDEGSRSPELADIHAWSLLIQLDDSFAHYGDGGAFFAVLPTNDLQTGRFDRTVCGSDSL